jgi:hypothetical protein
VNRSDLERDVEEFINASASGDPVREVKALATMAAWVGPLVTRLRLVEDSARRVVRSAEPVLGAERETVSGVEMRDLRRILRGSP